jgi:hypothetical protein
MDGEGTLEEKLENTFSSAVVMSPREIASAMVSGR